jgi:hypothetical protein
MKRGILELPEETRESADAMRRVVADQITALNELSEIISRHGKTLDLSSPSLGEPRHVAPRPPEPKPVAAAVGAETTSWSEGEASVASSHRPLAEARRATNGGIREPRPAPAPARNDAPPPAMPARAAPRPMTARSAGPGGSDEERGWVSDLLRRASRDDESGVEAAETAAANGAAAAPVQVNGENGHRPPPAGGPLNLLAADIAKAIDHDASVELWERHQRGEGNLFTRRLYTLQGQQTFDEIRRKYQRDQEFKTAVDRYITDFEKLLTEVNRNSKDRTAGNSYLSSDTG